MTKFIVKTKGGQQNSLIYYVNISYPKAPSISILVFWGGLHVNDVITVQIFLSVWNLGGQLDHPSYLYIFLGQSETSNMLLLYHVSSICGLSASWNVLDLKQWVKILQIWVRWVLNYFKSMNNLSAQAQKKTMNLLSWIDLLSL